MMEGNVIFPVCVRVYVCVREDKFEDDHLKLSLPTFAQISHIQVITSNQLCNGV